MSTTVLIIHNRQTEPPGYLGGERTPEHDDHEICEAEHLDRAVRGGGFAPASSSRQVLQVLALGTDQGGTRMPEGPFLPLTALADSRAECNREPCLWRERPRGGFAMVRSRQANSRAMSGSSSRRLRRQLLLWFFVVIKGEREERFLIRILARQRGSRVRGFERAIRGLVEVLDQAGNCHTHVGD
jgi:hypothetical protein